MKRNYNLLLVNPWIYDFTAYDFWSKPLGLLYIASILIEQDYKISYIDCMDRYNREILKLQNRELPQKDEFGRGPFYKEEVKKPEVLKNIPRRFSRYGLTEDVFINELTKISSPQAVLILEGLIHKKLAVRLHTPNGIHVLMINEKIALKMYQAGVKTIRLGFETVDPRLQSETGGKVTNLEFKKAVDYLLKAGFKTSQIGAYILIGLPGQNLQEIIDSIRFVIDCGAHPRLVKFSAIPGTKIWSEAKSHFNLEGEVDPPFS